VLASVLVLVGCNGADPQAVPTIPASPNEPPLTSAIRFVDIASQAGLVHPVICGAADKPYLIDTNGTGAAVLDYDGDGWMDLYVVHGSTLEDWDRGPTPNRLYRNLGDGTFEEVGERVGVADRAWGSGVLAWDYDNDGDPDLYVTNYGPNRLYRNDGGHFTEVAEEAGLVDLGWSMGAAAADYDSDGDLDLYVAHYFYFDIEDPPGNTGQGGDRICKWRGADVACGPIGFEPEPDRLFRNEGNGSFADVSEEAGILQAEHGHGMGVVWIDLDHDGLQDIYVANDAAPNLAYRNRGDGRFSEIGDWSGLALGESGVPMSGMGVAVGDTDGDGQEEIFISNYSHQSNSLYFHQGAGMYDDLGALAGLGDASFRLLGWGATFFDVELDGDLDLMVANGHVYPQVDEVDPTTSYDQRDQLFLNNGRGGFDEWQPPPDSPLAQETSSRGLVRVDFDNDGDSDLLITGMDGPPMLLRNDTETGSHWLGLELEASVGHREPVAARIRVLAGDVAQERVHRLGSSYMASEDPRHLVGLGAATTAVVEVRWPSGKRERWPALESCRYHRLTEGQGDPIQ
jgi:hypothetical protein